ncbi:transposable element-related [Holotrichia oblita]|uniref:Transposable element-related n=1 Tax=Holotrichia oblita TaxID=644536 RepID=A0ACB9SZL2_HOLOL|nr:transposable element-related [Holotrichia oblita]
MHVNEVTKTRICTKVEEGWSMRRVADEFRISKSPVSRICKKWREERNLSRTPGSGRPRISNAQEDDGLITYINRNPFNTAKNAIRNTGFPGSAKTGLRRLRHAGLYSYMTVNKTFLTPAWKEQRMGFVLHHLARNIWDKIIFSDEKIFQSSYNGKIRVFRPPSNCPVHKSQRTTQRLNANGISVLDFPSYSGDLNVIENVWDLMVRNIARQNVYVQSREELLTVVQAAWAR